MKALRPIRLAHPLLALCIFACGSSTFADLIYHDIEDVPIFDGTYDLDLNTDGVVDFILESVAASQFIIMPQGNNRAVVNGSLDLAPLQQDFDISLTLSAPYSWSSAATVPISACMTLPPPDGFTCTGEFFGQTAFMGLEFDVSGDTHYAWVRLDHSDLGAGGYLLDYAYETAPDVGILAGAGIIPEPSTFLLLVLGGLGLAITRKPR